MNKNILLLVGFIAFAGVLTAQKGWIALFDGKNLDQWHSFKKTEVNGWKIENGILTSDGKGGDLVTNQSFSDFVLEFEFKVEPKGNSGIIYKVQEVDDKAYFATYASGPEFQIIDDKGYPAELKPEQKTGANYDIHAPSSYPSNPPGNWNTGKIQIKKNKITHWVNGKKVVSYTYGTPDWQAAVAKSKFASWPYAKAHAEGKIALQGHNDPISFRNIRIKKL
jgi:hypothetical protein